jgi:hypothetical protein
MGPGKPTVPNPDGERVRDGTGGMGLGGGGRFGSATGFLEWRSGNGPRLNAGWRGMNCFARKRKRARTIILAQSVGGKCACVGIVMGILLSG